MPNQHSSIIDKKTVDKNTVDKKMSQAPNKLVIVDHKNNKKSPLAILLSVAAIIIILSAFKIAAVIVVPTLLALFIAITCSPLINMLTRYKFPLWLSVSLLILIMFVMFSMLASLIGSSINEFTRSIPEYKQLLAVRLSQINSLMKHYDISASLPQQTILENFDPSAVMNIFRRLLTGFSGAVANIFILFLLVIFMLFEAPSMKKKLVAIFAARNSNSNSENSGQESELPHLTKVLDGVIRYLGVKTITSLITAVIVWIVLVAFDVQYAILWSMLTFLLNYIPNIGAILATVPIVLQTVILNGVSTMLIVFTLITAANFIIGNIWEPRLMGRTLGLSTLVVFLSLIFWDWMFGSVGMLLSVPLTMAIRIALETSSSTMKYAYLLGEGRKPFNPHP